MNKETETGAALQVIRDYRTGDILFEGVFDSVCAGLEQAVRDNVPLDFADLSRANLVNAALDEAQLRHARFAGANLMGANLSEACLDGADFSGAVLQSACLCFSSLRRCNFSGVIFGATDIAGCDVSHSVFSTLSAFSLNFRDAHRLEGCLFSGDGGKAHYPFSRPPVVVQGLRWPVILMDYHIRVGGVTGTIAEILRATNDNNTRGLLRAGENGMHAFIQGIGGLLRELVITARPGMMGRTEIMKTAG